MVSRRLLLGATIFCLVVGALGALLYLQQRAAQCNPLFARELLPNADFALVREPGTLPDGWNRRAGGVELRGPAVDGQGFDLDGDGRAMQLLGIGNYLQTPTVTVQPGVRYCVSGFALTDSIQRSPTRVRVAFHWYDEADQHIQSDRTLWQPVVLWTPEQPPRDWSPILGSFEAPAEAVNLTIRFAPASDDRIYLDRLRVRHGGVALAQLAAMPDPRCCDQ
ncbi:MAG: hypothetical protein EOM24_18010 [Chloroflexia bacterium]|nr:hypothetical protein [Chloroflexia bacterium]